MATVRNPIVPGWYADPEARFYEGKYWVYVTRSFTAYDRQMNLDVFSSQDLVHWRKHSGILDMEGFPWVYQAVWAPTVEYVNRRYYLVFASNDIHRDSDLGGLEIAVSDSPAGPFRALLPRPLLGEFYHGAQPIDAHLFRDEDGTVHLYYGGWGHCNVGVMNRTMDGLVPFDNGNLVREVTPPGYVEGPCMLKRKGRYHFMWSEGGWGDGSYRVCASASHSPLEISADKTVVLQSQEIAEGPGHHGYLQIGEDNWLIAYHRRMIGDREAGHRMLCLDKLEFEKGKILPVCMTKGFELG